MDFQTIIFEIADGTAIVTINRPDKMNALNKVVCTELELAAEEISGDKVIRTAIVTGSGTKAFVAGADISEFRGLSKAEAMAFAKRGQDIFFKIENNRKPIIAAVNGFALGGGCELAMACHFRIAGTSAKFGQPEVNLGLIPGYGGTQRLTALVGKGKAMELNMTGRIIDAAEAMQWGLVNEIVEPEDLLPRAKEICQLIQTKAPFAVSRVIACVNDSVDGNKEGFDNEVKAFGECFDTADVTEGTTAFLEKRKPSFTGK